MSTYIYIMDKDYNLISELAILDMREIIELRKEASNHNLDCLSFLDFVGENIYNHLQVIQIKKEIEFLQTTSHLKNTLDVLQKAVDQMPIDSKYYLRFSGE